MLTCRPVILLTGFGPFPGVPDNVSALLAISLAELARRAFPGYRVHREILRTEWQAGPERAAALLATLRPVLALHLGVSSKAVGLTIETRAHNLCRPLGDAAGLMPSSGLISGEGPEFLAARVPAALAVHRLRQLGIGASASRDAGGYLCNAVLYRSLDCATRMGLASRIGFLHLPQDLPGSPDRVPDHCQRARRVRPARRLGWQQAVTGGLVVMATALGQSPRLALRRARMKAHAGGMESSAAR